MTKPLTLTLPDGRVVEEPFCTCGHSQLGHFMMKNDPCSQCSCNGFKKRDPSAELTDDEIKEYIDGFCCNCPRCDTETERISRHERDSSGDSHKCPKCGWTLPEMATWNIVAVP